MDNPEFKTPDPALTGFLMAKGFEASKVDYHNSQIAFVFPVTSELKRAIEDYSFNSLVPVRDLIGGYRRAMTLIRNARQNQNSKFQEYKNHDESTTRQ